MCKAGEHSEPIDLTSIKEKEVIKHAMDGLTDEARFQIQKERKKLDIYWDSFAEANHYIFKTFGIGNAQIARYSDLFRYVYKIMSDHFDRILEKGAVAIRINPVLPKRSFKVEFVLRTEAFGTPVLHIFE